MYAIYQYGNVHWIGPNLELNTVIKQKYHIDRIPLMEYTNIDNIQLRFMDENMEKAFIIITNYKRTRIIAQGSPMTFDMCFRRIMEHVRDEIFVGMVMNEKPQVVCESVRHCLECHRIIPVYNIY
jgi:hypothetical protein